MGNAFTRRRGKLDRPKICKPVPPDPVPPSKRLRRWLRTWTVPNPTYCKSAYLYAQMHDQDAPVYHWALNLQVTCPTATVALSGKTLKNDGTRIHVATLHDMAHGLHHIHTQCSVDRNPLIHSHHTHKQICLDCPDSFDPLRQLLIDDYEKPTAGAWAALTPPAEYDWTEQLDGPGPVYRWARYIRWWESGVPGLFAPPDVFAFAAEAELSCTGRLWRFTLNITCEEWHNGESPNVHATYSDYPVDADEFNQPHFQPIPLSLYHAAPDPIPDFHYVNFPPTARVAPR